MAFGGLIMSIRNVRKLLDMKWEVEECNAFDIDDIGADD